jgi:hypothetical protein
LLLCAASALPVSADILVGAGATLSITNTEDLGSAPIQMGAGATLAFGGAAAGSGGLNEYTRTGATGLGSPIVTSYGTWTRITTNAFWASTTITNSQTEYIYTGRWYVPNAGLYSFFEYIDDMDMIAIDGAVVLQSTSWTDAVCVRNVSLAAGWHDLELRAFNGASSGGMVNNTLASGFLFSPSNDLISVANQTNAFPFVDTGSGASLLSVHNGTLAPKIFVAGEATFDLTQQNLAAPLILLGGLLPAAATNAKVTVSGGNGEILFGGANTGVHFSPFNADIAFTGVENPAGVTFRDYSTAIAWPTSCLWRIANNATVALNGTNMLGTGDVTLTNFNIYVLSPYAVAAGATIHVQGTNRTVFIKPCTIDTNGNWSGAQTVLTNSVSLEGVNPTAHFPINVSLTLQGSISGTGSVIKTGSLLTEIKAPCSFVGPVSVSDTGTLIFDATTAGDSNNTVTVNAGATFSLYPTGYGTTETAAWIKTLTGGGTSGKIFMPAKQTLTIDTFNGALTVQGSGSALCVNALGSNATLVVSGQTAVTITSAAPGATLVLGTGASLTVPSTGVSLEALTLTSGSFPVSGNLTVTMLGGAGKLVKQGSDTLTVCFSTNTAAVQVDAGKLTLSPPATNTVLGSLPALWLDASASGVFTQYKSYAFTNGFINIERWNDCRPGAPLYGYNSRGNDNQQVYPYVMTNNQNGLSVVSMGSYQLTLSPPYIGPEGGGVEARRMPLSTNIYPQYAVMVFGSQKGGGAAVLGGNAAFYRVGSTSNDFRNPATPILATAGYPVWTNGVSVVATNTGLTGGYQILSVNTKGQLVNALGWRLDSGTAGGQNYGEVLFYTNALTTAQRLTAEAYLAKKWNLPFAYACELSNVTVAAGATVEIGSTFSAAQLFGAGTVIATGGSAIQPSGYFTGSLTLNGGAFSVTNMPVPPKAANISTAGLSCWFDPSVTNRIVFGSAFTPSRPLAVAALYDRTTTNRYLFGSCNTDTTYDRRPCLSATNGPLGETQYWLDYTNSYSGDSNGNSLRLYRNPAYIGANNATGAQTPTNVQTAFIVLDSSRGGGVPISYDIGGTQVFTRDNPQSASSPIWGSATAGAVKYGQTFLDGTAVNGATTGYRGTTELLSFVATNAVQAAFFGAYGGDGAIDGNKNRERLGEIILFDSALTNTVRADIEAYLMEKWLGKLRAGYSDFTAATVTGNGTVIAAKISQLPVLGAGFTGGIALTDASFAFTVSTNAARQYVVAPALTAPAALTVPAAGTISVNFLAKPMVGTYTLLNYGTATGFSNWSLTTSGDRPSGTVVLRATATALNIVVIPQGTLLRVL